MTAASNHGASGDDALVQPLRQARHIIRCQAVDLDRARLELAATQARATAFARQLDAALLRVAWLEQSVARLEAEQGRLTALLLAGATDEAEIALLARHRDEAHRLRQSVSWRVTRPLRALRQPRLALRILIDRLTRDRGRG
jgi:dsDNA-binding SOS-regulon protein